MTRRTSITVLLLSLAFTKASFAATPDPPVDMKSLLSRTGAQITKLLDQFANVKCTEEVERDKFRSDGKVELKQAATYDYLVILADRDGDLSLQESRIAVHEPKGDKRNTPMLLSNGFATLFLVFHPYYSESFRFIFAGEEANGNRTLARIQFEPIPGMRSPGALALRGREYPLELSGEAWIDPATGIVTRIEAEIGDTLRDVGLKSLRSSVEFAPAPFRDLQAFWFPVTATVDVETPRQHWRNIHHFTDYKLFSVGSEEHVNTK
jgi:hypothetical protein